MESPEIRLLRIRHFVETETSMVMETVKQDDHFQIIQLHYNQLLNSMTSVGDIVAEIFQGGYLTDLEREYLQSFESTPIRASGELLNIIMRKSNDVYENFLLALKNAKQQDAYLLLTTTCSGEHIVHAEHRRLIRQCYEWLTKNISCDSGLIALLFEKGVLTIRELEYIGSKTDKFRKNETLLFTISRKSFEDFATFQQALIETGQNAVVERLNLSSSNEGTQPNESDEHGFLIQQKFFWLAENIGPKSGLIELLYQREVITFRERESINAEKDAVKMNESLLKIICQKSSSDFEHFKNALSETKQDHVIQQLLKQRPKMAVEISQQKNTRQIIHKQISLSKPRIPSKPKHLHDRPKSRLRTNNPTTNHPSKAESQKIRTISFSKTNFEKLEKTMQIEISLKVTRLHRQNCGVGQNLLKLCLHKVLGESQDILIEMKRKHEAEKNAFIQERELETEKLNLEINAAKKAFDNEVRLRHKSEHQNERTIEMFERMKKQFEKQASGFQEENMLLKFQIDTMHGVMKKENLLKEKAEHDLLEERNTVSKLKEQLEEAVNEQHKNESKLSAQTLNLDQLGRELLQIRSDLDLMAEENFKIKTDVMKYTSDIAAADHRSSQLEESLRSITVQLSVLLQSTTSFLSLETERLDDATKKLMHLEERVKFATGKITSKKNMDDASSTDCDSRTQELAEYMYMYKELEELIKFENLARENLHLNKKCKELEVKLENFKVQHNSKGSEITKPSFTNEIKAEDTLLGENGVRALAILENELFLLYYGVPEIEVYDTMCNQFLLKLNIPNVSDPWDITAGEIDKCLFILASENEDDEKSIIFKLNARGELIDPWPTPSGGSEGLLSAYESNVVVCLWEEYMINEFSRNGDLVHTVQLSSDAGIINPFNAIKVTSNHYVVSYGYRNDDIVRICLMDLDGNVRKLCTKFDQRRRKIKELIGSDKRQQCGIVTNGLCRFIEDDKGSLLVADLGSNKICLLSSNLEHKKTLIQFSDQELPETLSFDETKTKLFVAINTVNTKGVFKRSTILVYNV